MAEKVKPFREALPDGEIKINLHSGQTAVDRSKARFVFMLGSPQVGKTCYGPVWLMQEIARCGAGDYLAVTATYDLFKLKMLSELLKTFDGGEAVDKDGKAFTYKVGLGRYWAGMRIIELAENLEQGKFWAKNESDPMWGRIILRSAEAKGGLVSTTAKAAWVDEPGTAEFVREAWDNCRDRVALSQGRILGTATIYVNNWMKSEIWLPWKKGDKSIEVISVDALVNPSFPRDEYEHAKATLPKWKFNMKYRGIYENPAGMIYDSFNEETHKIPRFKIPYSWPVFTGHDFGSANPAAMFVAQVKLPLPDDAPKYLRYNDLIQFHSYKPGIGVSVQQHVDFFKKFTDGYHVVISAGGSHQEQEIRQAYTNAGWRIFEPKILSVEAGIANVYSLHKQGRIYSFADNIDYLDEKLSYSYELDEQYQPTDVIADKQKYHLMDCLVAGTLVNTKQGLKPIENIKIGDKVLTRKGYFPVKDTIRKYSDTIEVYFSNGTFLRGTPNHSVFIKNKGFAPLHSLHQGAIIETWKEKLLFTMVGNTEDTLAQRGGLIESTLNPVSVISTVSSGKMLMVRYLKVVLSTIKTLIHLIMIYLTLSAREMVSICQNIWLDIFGILNIWQEYALSPFYGIAPQKVGSGIANTEEKLGRIGNQWLKSVSNVVGNMKQLNHRIANFALKDANSDVAIREKEVCFVSRKSSRKSIVYDLNIDTVHEYFANGILVHNSERAIMSFFKPDTQNDLGEDSHGETRWDDDYDDGERPRTHYERIGAGR